jgi:hypothetical protein
LLAVSAIFAQIVITLVLVDRLARNKRPVRSNAGGAPLDSTNQGVDRAWVRL